MYGVEVLAPPTAQPVAVEELRAWLRLNDQAEDAKLAELLAAAVELFEHDTARPVLSTSYWQSLSTWPCPIVGLGWSTAPTIALGRGGVTAVTAVRKYDAAGSLVDLAASDWRADLATPPARVALLSTPATVTTAAGIPVTPVGVVDFVAGWSNAAAVPKQLRVALKLLAGHWYEHPEAYG